MGIFNNTEKKKIKSSIIGSIISVFSFAIFYGVANFLGLFEAKPLFLIGFGVVGVIITTIIGLNN